MQTAIGDYSYLWWIGDFQAWNGHTIYAARGGSGQAIDVVGDLDLVITHKVDYGKWRGGWSQVNTLVRRIMDAKVF